MSSKFPFVSAFSANATIPSWFVALPKKVQRTEIIQNNYKSFATTTFKTMAYRSVIHQEESVQKVAQAMIGAVGNMVNDTNLLKAIENCNSLKTLEKTLEAAFENTHDKLEENARSEKVLALADSITESIHCELCKKELQAKNSASSGNLGVAPSPVKNEIPLEKKNILLLTVVCLIGAIVAKYSIPVATAFIKTFCKSYFIQFTTQLGVKLTTARPL